jgi:Icc-related predicted phosphoesterase
MEPLIALKDHIRENKKIYDIVLISGDFQSYSMAEFEDPIKCALAEEEITSILTYAESICPNVYYIPGNHDPPDLFYSDNIPYPSLVKQNPGSCEEKQLKENCHNVHGKIMEIAKGLKIFGYGGSKDNRVIEDGKDIESIWEAFPYKDEEDYEVGLNSLIAQLSHEHSQDKNLKVIAMTHIGPRSSESSNDHDHLPDGKYIETGSKALDNALDKHRDFILFNIHGHSHGSEKLTKVNSVPVINSNCMFLRNYGEVFVNKNLDTEQWEFEDVKFYKY